MYTTRYAQYDRYLGVQLPLKIAHDQCLITVSTFNFSCFVLYSAATKPAFVVAVLLAVLWKQPKKSYLNIVGRLWQYSVAMALEF